MKPEIIEFLEHSNFIENEIRDTALDDAIKSWKFAFQYRNNITLKYILSIHKHLMRRIRPDIAGKFRTNDVWIGGEHKKYTGREDLLIGLHKFVNSMSEVESLPKYSDDKKFREKITKEAHVMFEKIHPFSDGNGRTGRILYNIHRLKLGLPIHIIHEEEKQQYYKWFH